MRKKKAIFEKLGFCEPELSKSNYLRFLILTFVLPITPMFKLTFSQQHLEITTGKITALLQLDKELDRACQIGW